METLYVIDAPNMAHRAAATGDLRPQLGAMLRRFLRVAEPRHVVGGDDREASFRRDLWSGYKADRPHELAVDLDVAREVMDGFKIPSIPGMLGVEADDLIATLAARAPRDVRVVALSSDKDLFQVLDKRTYLAVRRGGKSRLYRPEDVVAEHGVEPRQWPAVMALAGQKNGIPGLAGIGLKGACSLLSEHGDLEQLLSKVRTVAKASYRQALEAQADDARLYLRLMTLLRDLPVECRLGRWQR